MRLIDADAYKKHLASFVVGGEKAIVENGIGNYWIDGIHTAYREIDNAPTIKTFTLADIEENYRKGLEKGLEEARPHGEWQHDQFGDFFKSVLCSNCDFRSAFEFPFCPSCGSPMTEEAFRKYNGLKEGKAEEKKTCPCDTCQTAIDRCGCQMHLCSDYQKWKEGEAE